LVGTHFGEADIDDLKVSVRILHTERGHDHTRHQNFLLETITRQAYSSGFILEHYAIIL
jgi:hypothetical protein